MDLKAIRGIAYEELGKKRSHSWKEIGNKFDHGQRTATVLLQLRRQVLPDDDSHDEMMTVAAWFHDLCNGEDKHEEKGAVRTKELLTGLIDEPVLDEICELIRLHDIRSAQIDRSVWLKLLQDADWLDHFGAYDAWMATLELCAEDRTLAEAADYMLNTRYEEYPRFKKMLQLQESLAIFDARAKIFLEYAKALVREARGELI